MLKQIDMNKNVAIDNYEERISQLEIQMGELQRRCKDCGIPIMVVFEGFEASGKGTMINKMIKPLDPRGFKVYSMEKSTQNDRMHPYFWRYFIKTPPKGRIHIFDRSWYQGLETSEVTVENIRQFEKQFTDDGMVLIKFFLAISKKEQKKRLSKLENNKNTRWRVEKADWKKNKKYDKRVEYYDSMLVKTDTDNAPWTLIESLDKKYAILKIYTTIVNRLTDALNKADKSVSEPLSATAVDNEDLQNTVLQGVDLNVDISEKEYRKRKKELQKRLSELHNKMFLKRVPVILAFEGWDAGGKGGAIKRITQCIDPRGYEVVPISAPNDIEKAHHYLWRFWEKFPKDGHMTIFDRTWYGRVMVERIEGFTPESDWKRAYSEINNMEASLVDSGAILLKFWMHIDKDEQAKRFKLRQETKEKMWKITDEDWRNREKWDEYEKAVDEMIVKTSTKEAPWHIIEANSKYYARIKVLETVVEALEKRLQ